MRDAILLIDDTPDKRDALSEALKKEFASSEVDIILVTQDSISDFLPSKEVLQEAGIDSGAPEDRFCYYLESNPNIKLVVVDHDLSLLNSQLSEPVVATACQNAGVPHCRYSRTTRYQTTRQKLIELVEKSHVYSVKLDISDIDNLEFGIELESTKTVRCIFEGFNQLRSMIETIDEELLSKGPAAILAHVLDFPGLESIFHRYASAYSVMAEVLKIREIIENDRENLTKPIIKNRLTYTLGFWLYNVILKYPGVILNDAAAASYLNLSSSTFTHNKDKFHLALYNGPFSSSELSDYWWRYSLDDILIDNGYDDGVELLRSSGVEDIEHQLVTCRVSLRQVFTVYLRKKQYLLSILLEH